MGPSFRRQRNSLVIAALGFGVAAFLVGIVYASLAEWVIHRWLMHRPLWRFKHFFVGHAKIHHGIYRADPTYHVGERPKSDLTFAWWAMPIPTVAHFPVIIPIAIWFSIPAAVGLVIAFSLYQTTYEVLHYYMHVPTGRWVERTWAFKWIDAHHFQHHRKHSTNLNVVLPIADFLFRTRVRPPRPTVVAALAAAG